MDVESTEAAIKYLNGYNLDGKDLIVKKAEGMVVPKVENDEIGESGLSDYDRLRKQIVQKEKEEYEERLKKEQEIERKRQFEILSNGYNYHKDSSISDPLKVRDSISKPPGGMSEQPRLPMSIPGGVPPPQPYRPAYNPPPQGYRPPMPHGGIRPPPVGMPSQRPPMGYMPPPGYGPPPGYRGVPPPNFPYSSHGPPAGIPPSRPPYHQPQYPIQYKNQGPPPPYYPPTISGPPPTQSTGKPLQNSKQ